MEMLANVFIDALEMPSDQKLYLERNLHCNLIAIGTSQLLYSFIIQGDRAIREMHWRDLLRDIVLNCIS